jgi:hypothetical protein
MAGDYVIYGGVMFKILAEYDEEFVYLAIGLDGAHLAHRSDLKPVTKH